MRTVYVVVNTSGAIGSADWRDEQDDLPRYDASDAAYRLNVPDGVTPDGITDALDALLGDYDLPDGWECGPITL